MTGNDKSRWPDTFRMQFGATRVAGKMFVVSPRDSDKILAVSLWFPPGTYMMKECVIFLSRVLCTVEIRSMTMAS